MASPVALTEYLDRIGLTADQFREMFYRIKDRQSEAMENVKQLASIARDKCVPMAAGRWVYVAPSDLSRWARFINRGYQRITSINALTLVRVCSGKYLRSSVMSPGSSSTGMPFSFSASDVSG